MNHHHFVLLCFKHLLLLCSYIEKGDITLILYYLHEVFKEIIHNYKYWLQETQWFVLTYIACKIVEHNSKQIIKKAMGEFEERINEYKEEKMEFG